MKELRKELGKISSVYFGLGGYQDCELGIHFSFSMKGSGVCDSRAAWDYKRIEHTKSCQWTEEERTQQYAEIMRYVSTLLNDAKVDSINKLKDIPVELTFDGNLLKDWRILTEVI